jgi:hypothetical protein
VAPSAMNAVQDTNTTAGLMERVRRASVGVTPDLTAEVVGEDRWTRQMFTSVTSPVKATGSERNCVVLLGPRVNA